MQRQLSLALALVTAGLLGTTTQASAQQKATPPSAAATKPDTGMWNTNPADRLLQKKTDLNLTDAQVKKLETLKTKFASKTTSDTGKAAWATRRKQNKEAMAVLTTEQKNKLNVMRADQHAARRARHDSLHQTRHGATVAPTDTSMKH